MGMGEIWELLNGKIWEWDLSFRWEWEWDGNWNEVIEMRGICYEKSIPAHLYSGYNKNCVFHVPELMKLNFCSFICLMNDGPYTLL